MRISDWSSDVCSSDLRHAGDVDAVPEDLAAGRPVQPGHETHEACLAGKCRPEQHVERPVLESQRHVADVILAAKSLGDVEIGSASCRARVGQYVYNSGVAVSLKTKINANKTKK